MPPPRKDTRPSAAIRGYDRRWAKAKKRYLATHPTCVYCAQEGRIRPANTVDHIVPHKGNTGMFWNVNNWAACCRRCNSRKGDKPLRKVGFGNDKL